MSANNGYTTQLRFVQMAPIGRQLRVATERYAPLNMEIKMKKTDNGFLYIIFSFVVKVLNYINLVELLKRFFVKKFKNKRMAQNYVIDIFNIVKFIFVIIAIHYKISNQIIFSIIIYLGAMNLFTYFYYHCWDIPKIRDIEHSRRRFTALVTSFFYNILIFSYIYLIKGTIIFKNFTPYFKNSFQISIANAFASSAISEPTGLNGFYLVTLQIITTFIYVVLLLSQTIPHVSENEIEVGNNYE